MNHIVLRDLSDCELRVMKCLWESDHPMTVPELIRDFKRRYEKPYKETTMYTFLKRLTLKKYVTFYKKGNSHFSPLISEVEYLENYARVMREFWGEESLKIFLEALGEDTER